jgi:chemotaxis protein methyltransferase CheR
MVAERIPEGLCRRLGEFIAQHTGLDFPPERHPDLRRALASAAEEFGFHDSADCARWLLSKTLSPAQLNALASHLTVGETYFFREQPAFAALSQHILPELLHQRRGREQHLRLWSAACCTGEEPYSLAILVDQLLGRAPDWHVTILATDINERFLQRAVAGVYGDWSFRNAPAGLQERYFTRSADRRWVVTPAIKQRVRFEHLNLARDAFPSLETDTAAMDVILCRNVLMYFTQPQAQAVIARLQRALVNDGRLIVGASEYSYTLFSQFSAETVAGGTVYRKHELERPNKGLALPEQPMPLEQSTRLQQSIPLELPELPEPLSGPVTRRRPPQSLSLRARELADQGRFVAALAASEHWIAADKVNFAAHYLHAMILQETGNSAASRHSLNRALYLQPEFAPAHFALGNLARAAARHAEAAKHFQNALHVLQRLPPGETLAETDGMTAGRLVQIIHTLLALCGQATTRERMPT